MDKTGRQFITPTADNIRTLAGNGLLGSCEQSVGSRWISANGRLDNARILTPMQDEAVRSGVRPTKPLPQR